MPQGRAAASRLAATLAIGACVVLVPAASAGEAPGSGAPHVNRLAQSNSPYLLSHANQPVDWYPWGPEALAKAKRENKPIFLSVGYRTCYWCHVAARSIYAKPEFAREMSAPGGGFYTAQDAEVDGREGASYAWMKPEIDSACGARAPAFFDVYSLTPLPAPPVGETADLRLLGEDEGVIRVRLPIVETLRRASSATAVGLIESLRPARDRLLEVRNRRKQPLRDEKIVVALNGLAIEAFAEAGRLLARRDLPVSGTMRATVTVQACDDQVCLPPSRMPVTAGMGN